MARIASLLFGMMLALVASMASVQAQTGDTRIRLKYGIKATFAENPDAPDAPRAGSSGIARHSFLLVLKPQGEVTEAYEGGGVYKLSITQQTKLGGVDAQRTQYRVVDSNTIQRISENDNQAMTLTIRVSGKSCKLEYETKLKEGKKNFVGYSQSRGRMLNYRSFELAESTCTIE
jgi:hypothetical protein